VRAGQLSISRVIGKAVLAGFHLYGLRVYQDLANCFFAISSREVNPFAMNGLVSVD
jgi:hypothetical protein